MGRLCFEIETAELAPGYYDLRIGCAFTNQRFLRVEVGARGARAPCAERSRLREDAAALIHLLQALEGDDVGGGAPVDVVRIGGIANAVVAREDAAAQLAVDL